MSILTNPSNWPPSPALAVCAVLATLYAQGGRRRRADRHRFEGRRAAAFYGGLATIVLALDTPIDAYADRLFSVHMVQHVLLITVAPPLIVLGRPWPRLWRPLPVSARRAAARGFAALAPLARPPVALALLVAALAAWHVPVLYGATLHNDLIHQVEHLSFVVTALLFWATMLGTPPLRARVDGAQRCAYFVIAMVPGWVLAIVLAFARTPLYAYPERHGGLSSLADQQIAAGVMWVPGSIAYLVAAVWSFYVWLEPVGSPRPRLAAAPR